MTHFRQTGAGPSPAFTTHITSEARGFGCENAISVKQRLRRKGARSAIHQQCQGRLKEIQRSKKAESLSDSDHTLGV